MGKLKGSRRHGFTIAAGAAIAFALLLAAVLTPPPSSAAIRKNFVRHQEANWVWYGPQSWFASSGPNDINIASPTGTLWLKFGSGGAVCPSSANEWFQSVRSNYRSTAGNGFGLYSKPLRGARFTSIGRIRQFQSAQHPVYYRQNTRWVGRKRNGQQIRGEFIMDVFANNFGTCGQNFLSIGAPSRRNGRSIGLLKDVFSTLANQSI
ncbi:MAG: hypothetical protein ACSLFD_09590 [Solirubrobacterales bacterium]